MKPVGELFETFFGMVVLWHAAATKPSLFEFAPVELELCHLAMALVLIL